MNKNRLRFLACFGVLLFGVLGYAIISGRSYTEKLNHFISDNDTLDKITVNMGDVNWGDSAKSLAISDPMSLEVILACLKRRTAVVPDRSNIQSASIDLRLIRSGKHIDIEAVDSKYSGWIVRVGDNWYKSDSLISALLQDLANTKKEYAN